MNKGLSEELKRAFPNTIPTERPQIFDQKIFEPYWLAGFTSGEGSFGLNFFKSTTKLGETVRLKFYISQHDRDEQLIKSLIEYFKAGNVYNKQGNVINFEVTKFEDLIDKVIPFFIKYPIIGVKALDFSDFCIVAELIKNKAHLTPKGLDEIRLIKLGMNKERK